MKSTVIARIGTDVEVRYTPSGTAVANVSLAYSYGKKDDAGKYSTQWVDASLWGKRAEASAPYLKKGGQIVAFLDDVHIETYEKKDGTSSAKLVGQLSDFKFISGHDQQERQQEQSRPPSRRPSSNAAPSAEQFDDDIPF